jgi:hypothetical protein
MYLNDSKRIQCASNQLSMITGLSILFAFTGATDLARQRWNVRDHRSIILPNCVKMVKWVLYRIQKALSTVCLQFPNRASQIIARPEVTKHSLDNFAGAACELPVILST